MTESNILSKTCKCPSCFINWEETYKIDEPEPKDEKICGFCEMKPTSLQLLHRQINELERGSVCDLPKVLRHLLEHIQLH